jgi:hypothetical protein
VIISRRHEAGEVLHGRFLMRKHSVQTSGLRGEMAGILVPPDTIHLSQPLSRFSCPPRQGMEHRLRPRRLEAAARFALLGCDREGLQPYRAESAPIGGNLARFPPVTQFMDVWDGPVYGCL